MLSSFFDNSEGRSAPRTLPTLPRTLEPTERYSNWRLKTARQSIWKMLGVTCALLAWPVGKAVLSIWNGGQVQWPPSELLILWVAALSVMLMWPFVWYSAWRIRPLLALEPVLIATDAGVQLQSPHPKKSTPVVPWAEILASPRYLLIGRTLLPWRSKTRRSEAAGEGSLEAQPLYDEEEVARIIVSRIPVARQRMDADLILEHKSSK